MSNLSTFCFNSEDAVKYGVEEAVVLYHFRYWVMTNQSNGAHFHDGHYWLYNSHKSLTTLFPFFNEQKIKRLIANLVAIGVVKTGNYNKASYDRTTWYTVLEVNPEVKINVPVKTKTKKADEPVSVPSQDDEVDLGFILEPVAVPYTKTIPKSVQDAPKNLEDAWDAKIRVLDEVYRKKQQSCVVDVSIDFEEL